MLFGTHWYIPSSEALTCSMVNILPLKRPNDLFLKRNSSAGGGTLSELQRKVTGRPLIAVFLAAFDVRRVANGLSEIDEYQKISVRVCGTTRWFQQSKIILGKAKICIFYSKTNRDVN